jgi:hypothetical protein
MNYNAVAAPGVGSIQLTLRNLGVFPGTSLQASGGPISTDNVSITIDEATAIEGLQLLAIVDQSSLRASGQPSATINITEIQKGGGADFSGTGNVTFTLSDTSGTSVILTATADSGGASLDYLKLRAQLFPVVRRHQVTYPPNAMKPITPPNISPLLSREAALTYCTEMYGKYQVARATGTLRVESEIDDIATIESLVSRKVSDRITIINSHSGLNMDVHINNRRFEGTPDGFFSAYYGWEEAA